MKEKEKKADTENNQGIQPSFSSHDHAELPSGGRRTAVHGTSILVRDGGSWELVGPKALFLLLPPPQSADGATGRRRAMEM